MNISLSLSELCEAISVRESDLERSETAYLMKLITEASGVRAVGKKTCLAPLKTKTLRVVLNVRKQRLYAHWNAPKEIIP